MPESVIIGKADEVPPGKVEGYSVIGIKFLVANISHVGGPLVKLPNWSGK